ncbi:uncharacterized protein LOC128681680 [Plodia interpunctella]|uniref:uncharacterized protein LOC128681680 n=1 Tax=Plodia interpunctella TaxID=58824 RepID=UPI002368DD2C|nr:uncharacterized protein LOC128681680 [Plodia interpunctella]
MKPMDLEEMYQVLRGASERDAARYDIVQKWFRECGIIDGKIIGDVLFEHSYLRLCPNKEPIGLVQFIQLIGILSRETKLDIQTFLKKFQTVKDGIIREIQDKCVVFVLRSAESPFPRGRLINVYFVIF